MKRRLNILCLVVMLVLSYSVLEQGYYIFLGAKMGAQTGLELGKKGSDIAAYKELMNLKVVNLIPSSMESFDFFRDSVYNEKSRSYVPAAYSSLMVSVDSHDSVGKVVAKYLLIYLHLGFSLWAVVLFIRLIISSTSPTSSTGGMYVGCVDWEWHWLSASAVPLRHHILIL